MESSASDKGQLNSEWTYEVIVSPKMPHTSFGERFSDFNHNAETCLIFFPWNSLISKMSFLKKFTEPFWGPRRANEDQCSNFIKTKNDRNSKWKLVKIRWNLELGLSDLKNDLLTSMTSEGAQWIFSKSVLYFFSQYIIRFWIEA